ncbi:hypothetical protein Sxan_14870 [Streptomyces xanthophaeus]|uniref:Uncharacterized protein n=1 Tax=Streptomyces xanthophaeus TaxID=67385 RepID=A0A919L9Q8_9ACTN|nr:hypothetical protein Sxan_14870 [Streptomyces xanthophaeus]
MDGAGDRGDGTPGAVLRPLRGKGRAEVGPRPGGACETTGAGSSGAAYDGGSTSGAVAGGGALTDSARSRP